MPKSANTERTFLGHPKGLFVLFFTEMWERFSFHGMRAILILYLIASVSHNGLGLPKSEAQYVVYMYMAFVYIMSIPGGIIADRFLGAKTSVMIGGFLLCIGHWIMAIHHVNALYTALGFIILGVGLLKPNISIMVGQLYKELDARRERGFFIFYIGINFGALLATISVGLVQVNFGWHAAFGLAGFGMLLGQIFYIIGLKHLKNVGNLQLRKKVETKELIGRRMELSKEIRQFFSDLMANNVALILSLIGISIAGFVFVGPRNYLLGIMLFIITGFVAYFLIVQSKLNMIEKNRVRVLFVVFIIMILFNGGFEQSPGMINLYTHEKIDRFLGSWQIPTGFFQGLNSLFIILFAGLVAGFWAKRRLKRKESSALFKILVGVIFMGVAYLYLVGADYHASLAPFGKASFLWIVGFYLFATIAELCVQPVALSFITRLAPKKYASIMMGVFFAVTGLGSVLAYAISIKSKPDHIVVMLDPKHDMDHIIPKEVIAVDSTFELHANIDLDTTAESPRIVLKSFESGVDFSRIITTDSANEEKIHEFLTEHPEIKQDSMYHAFLTFKKNSDYMNSDTNTVGDGMHYEADLEIMELDSKFQYRVFFTLFAMLVITGFVLLLILKPLKVLTHGAEDIKEPKEIEDKMHGEILEI